MNEPVLKRRNHILENHRCKSVDQFIICSTAFRIETIKVLDMSNKIKSYVKLLLHSDHRLTCVYIFTQNHNSFLEFLYKFELH